MHTDRLLQQFPIISDQVDRRELSVIMRQLEQQLRRSSGGVIVEFGCYVGTTSLFIQRLIDAYSWPGEFHVYDSFAGLPDKDREDDSPAGLQFRRGELQTSKRQFVQNFRKSGLKLPYIHKGWFGEVSPDMVPDTIIFAFLDGDYYKSVRDPLALITPKLADGAVIVVDDYANEALPGAAKAVDQWMHGRNCRLRIEASLAIISK